MPLKLYRISLVMILVGLALYYLQSHRPVEVHIKNIEQYWTETGLKTTAVDDLFANQSCLSSEKYFLACANALTSVATRFNLEISTHGDLHSIANARPTQFITEKSVLLVWQDFYTQHKDEAAHLQFVKIWHQLLQGYIKPEQSAFMTGVALNGFISVFKDPHTYLLPIDYYKEVVSRSDNKSFSMGILVGHNGQNYYVRKVFAGSPAEELGLHKGDLIASVNGVATDNLLLTRLSEILRGSPGQPIDLNVVRNGIAKKFIFDHQQKMIPTVNMKVLNGIRNVGIISINKFATNTCEKTKQAIEILNAQKIRGLMLDLRDNPGGQMEEAACVVSLFVGPEQKIFDVSYLKQNRTSEEVFGNEEQVYKGPLVVLINSGSASAAEIVAGALRDLKRAALVGENSFGKGSFQEGEVWENNKNIALFETKGFYYLPSGVSPQLQGLEPDIFVASNDSLKSREADMFMRPLVAPLRQSHRIHTSVNRFKNCLNAEEGNPEYEDLDLASGRVALFCTSSNVAGGAQ